MWAQTGDTSQMDRTRALVLSVDEFGVCFLVSSYSFSKTWTVTGVRRDLRC